MIDVTQHTLTTIRDAIAAGDLSAADVTRAYLDRIDALDGELHTCNEVFHERALERARDADEGRVTGPLAGVPVMLKDNICTRFGRTTCSSRILENFRSPYDATVVRRLEDAGAIILAKTNLDEFAMGSSTENSAVGPTRNPWDTGRVPGGSSGGSAAAVAADLCAGSLGSDTGGSVRQPASLCGIVGVKPTYGLVSRYGLVAFASSLDQIGPFGHTVADAAALLNVIAGHDPMDSTSAPPEIAGPPRDYTADLDTPLEGLTLGLEREHYLSDANDPHENEAVYQAVELYKQMGVKVIDVNLRHTDYGIPCYYIIATAEASSNLARYDGVHYGHRTANPTDLEDLYAATRDEALGDEVERRIMLGTYALSSGYYDAYYVRALKVRRLVKRDFDEAFERCDAIICPTTAGPAFRFGEKTDDPLQMYLNDVYTVAANLSGVPAISVPCGFEQMETSEGGRRLPLGLQLLGPAFSEAKLLRIARMFERAAGLSGQRPALTA